MNSRTSIRFLILGACAVAAFGCAHTVPAELSRAMTTCQHSADGPAARLVPADLEDALRVLTLAKWSFADRPDSFETRDLAYVAQRRCEMADALAIIVSEHFTTFEAKEDLATVQGEIVAQTRADLKATRKALVAALAKLAAVRLDDRGLIITLSGSVLFRSDEAKLLDSAKVRLERVAEALLTTRDRQLLVEGFTDSQGTNEHNLDLSQRRADAVRTYLVGRGYAAGNIVAQGIGEMRPLADNATSEGRANNRRVEIVIQRVAPAQTGSAK